MKMRAAVGMKAEAALRKMAGNLLGVRIPKAKYEVECRRADGSLKWKADASNLVTNAGIKDVLTQYFKGASYTAAWYIGLVTGPNPTFAGADTMASHAGWTEFISYAETARQTLTIPTPSGTSVDNSASKATFTCNNGTNATVSGLFLANSSTKNGTTGVLYSEAAFTQGDKLVSNTDVLAITVTLSGVTQ